MQRWRCHWHWLLAQGQAQAQQNALSDILGMVGSGAFNGLFGGGKSIGNGGYGLKEKL